MFETPFIETQSVNFEVSEPFDWVFFNSPRAVQHGWEQLPQSIRSFCKVGALGKGTARALQQKGVVVSFCGSHPVEKAAEDFAQLVQSERVLFPVSNQGRRTVQKRLAPEQVIEKQAYSTLNLQSTLPADLDLIAFTSPSNVRSFLGQHSIPGDLPLVAIGNTTARELEQLPNPVFIAHGYHQQALLDRVMGLVFLTDRLA